MNYVGVDLHKEQSWFYVMDEAGNKLDSKSISNQPEVLKEYFTTIPKPFILAVEATYNCYFFVDIAESYADKVYLANSYELKAFAKRHKKTDKIDARLIADILRKGYLPIVTMPDKETRNLRELLHYRMNLVIDRSRNIVRLKCLMDRLGLNSRGRFTTYKGLAQIPTEGLTEEHKTLIASYVNTIETQTKEIYEFEKVLRERALKDNDVSHLMTTPGLDYFSAALVKTEIIEVKRFANFNRLCAYAGLAPKVHQSADKLIHGSLNTNRRKYLQWILIEVVPHFIKAQPELQKRYERIALRKGKNTARVVMAREMLKVIYHILKEKRPFYYKEQIRSAAAPALQGVSGCLTGSPA
jgi:transposase